jgi:hypothetical protein
MRRSAVSTATPPLLETAVGDGPYVGALGKVAVEESLDVVEHLHRVPGSDDPRLLERGVVDLVAPGDAPCVARRCPRALLGDPHLDDDDGLLRGDLLCLLVPIPAGLEAFNVHCDDLGVGVLAKIFKELPAFEVRLVTAAHELSDADS